MSQSVSFNENVAQLLEKVECRRVHARRDRDAVYRLRYSSYLREGAILETPTRELSDAFDDMENSWTYAIYIDGDLASSIRLCIATPQQRDIPARMTFPEFVEPLLDDGKCIVDPTRFVLSDRHARLFPKLPYVTLRVAWAVSDHIGADYTLASVRIEHQAFYRRFFGHRLLCPARPYPPLIKPLSLMIVDCNDIRERGLQRYPFLASTPEECRALLDDGSSDRGAP